MTWKRLIKFLIIVIVTIAVILFGGGMLLDGEIELKTESTLDAPPEIVHVLMADPVGVKR